MSIFGDVLGFAGNLVGAGVSHYEAKADRALSDAQFNQQMDYAKNQTQIRVQDALKAGINPLAALGVSANVSPTIHSGGGSGAGEYISRAGEHLSRLFARKQEDDIAYDNEAKELDLQERRLRNRILSNQVKESSLNLSKGAGIEQPSRIGDNSVFKVAYDLQGRPRLLVNQDVLEGDSDNAGYLASLKHAITQGFVDPVSGKITSEQYKMMLDDMHYNMYGKHITNLHDLYFSPAEAGFAAHAVIRGQS